MKKIICFSLLLFLLVACTNNNLPPSPPAPGGSVSAGHAVGGIQVDASKLPAWATSMHNTDITPTTVKFGDTVSVKVIGDYVYENIYVLYNADKYGTYGSWKPVSGSGSKTSTWFSNRGEFRIPVTSDNFKIGPIYVLSYGCDDSGRVDSDGMTIWSCNKGTNKWALGSFVIESLTYPELYQINIENNMYLNASKSFVSDGVNFVANYKSTSGINTEVSVLELDDISAFKSSLKSNLPLLRSRWNIRNPSATVQICGFLKTGTSTVPSEFSWLSNYLGKDYWITVKTYAYQIDDAKITKYAYKYVSDCELLNELNASICGDDILASDEECEVDDDCSAGEICDDCSCITAPAGPYCGDGIVNNNEQCEFNANCTGGKVCNNCTCVVPHVAVCGDGTTEGNEQCDDNNTISNDNCSSTCKLEICGDNITQTPREQCELPNTATCDENCMDIECGNDIIQADEDCEPAIDANCDNECKFICGNDKLDAGEQCDGSADALCPGKCDDKCRCTSPIGIWTKSNCVSGGWTPDPCSNIKDICTVNIIENSYCSNINSKCLKDNYYFTCRDTTAYKFVTQSVSLCGDNCNFANTCQSSNPEGTTCSQAGSTCVMKEQSIKQVSCERKEYDVPGANIVLKIPGSTYSFEKECPASMDCVSFERCSPIWIASVTRLPKEGDVCYDQTNKQCPCPANCTTIGNYVKHEYVCADVTVPKWLQTGEFGVYTNCASGIALNSECSQADLGKKCKLSDSVILKCFGNKLTSNSMATPAVVYEPTGYIITEIPESSNISSFILFFVAVAAIFMITIIHFRK